MIAWLWLAGCGPEDCANEGNVPLSDHRRQVDSAPRGMLNPSVVVREGVMEVRYETPEGARVVVNLSASGGFF